MNRRAVSPVLGLALLVGLVAAASVGLLFVSTALTDSTKTSIDHQQAELSMSELATNADALAAGEVDEAEYNIRGADGGNFRALPFDGDTVHIRVEDGEDQVVFDIERTMGSVVYDAPDGSQIAYQGGGVWRLDQSGHAVMVQPPQFHYREDPEPTLTYPMVLVREDFSARGSAGGTMRVLESQRHYPDEPNHYNPLFNGSVVVTIDSLYCEGWETFFRQRTGGSVTESCSSKGVTDESEVRIELSVPFEIDGFEQGGMFNGHVDDEHVNGSYSEGGHQMTSPTTTVKDHVEECEEGEGEDVSDGSTIEGGGLYCIFEDDVDDGQPFQVNTSGEEVIIASDGPLPTNGGLEVNGTGNVSVMVDDDLFDGPGQGNAVFGNESDPAQTRIFVSSGNDVRANAVELYALLYAPTSDVRFGGEFTMDGGIVANEGDFRGNSQLDMNPDVEDITINFESGDISLYFLHISETEVTFEPN